MTVNKSPLSYRVVKVVPANIQDNEYVLACNNTPVDWNQLCSYLNISQGDISETTKSVIQSYINNVVHQNNWLLISNRQEPVYKYYTRKPPAGTRTFYVLDTANKKAYICYTLPFSTTTTTNFENALSMCESEGTDIEEFTPNWNVWGKAVNERTKIKQRKILLMIILIIMFNIAHIGMLLSSAVLPVKALIQHKYFTLIHSLLKQEAGKASAVA